MFTGIVGAAKIKQILASSAGWELVIESEEVASKVILGSSVAIDGACLSVTKMEDNLLYFFVSNESIDKTIIRFYSIGNIVNIELPMQPTGYLGGHYVLGHVDTTASISSIVVGEQSWFFSITVPVDFLKYVVYKGSIAINGISLTINKVVDKEIELCIIPITIQKTNLSFLKENDLVNIEFDILAKYTEQLINKRSI